MIALIFGLAWLMSGAIAWGQSHLNSFTHISGIIFAALATMSFWFLYCSLGWQLTNRAFSHSHRKSGTQFHLTKILISTGLGIGIYSTAALIYGIWIGVSSTKILIFHGILVVVALGGYAGSFGSLREIWKQFRKHRWHAKEIVAIGGIVVAILTLLPFALTPVYFPDTLRYHFGVTQLFETAGRIKYFPDIAETNISLNWQLLYMGQLLVAGESCAQFFNWSTILLTLACIILMAKPQARIWALILALSFPFLLINSAIPRNDLGLAFFGALTWLTFRSPDIRNRWLLLGIFFGIGLGIKYSYMIAVISFSIAFLFAGRDPVLDRLKNIGTISFGAFIGYLPWFIKNSIWTGDPFYPTFSKYLPWAKPEGIHVAASYSRELSIYGGGLEGFQRWFLGIWRATTENSVYYETELGLVLWLCFGLLIFGLLFRHSLKLEIYTCLIFLGLWSAGPQITRFITPCIPLLAITTAELFPSVSIFFWKKLRGIVILIVCFSFWSAWITLASFSNPYDYFLRRESRDDYLRIYSPSYRTAQWLITHRKSDKRILPIGVDDISVFRNPLKYSGPFDTKWIVREASETKTPQELCQRVCDEGITFLYVDRKQAEGLDAKFGYLNFPDEESKKRFYDFFNHYTFLIRKDEAGETIRELREVIIPSSVPDKTP